MVFKGIIDSLTHARAYYLCQVKGLSVRTVASMCKISAASVYRIAHEKTYKKCTSEETPERGRHNKLSDRDKRRLIRCITVLRTLSLADSQKRGSWQRKTTSKGLSLQSTWKRTTARKFGKRELPFIWMEQDLRTKEIHEIRLVHQKLVSGERNPRVYGSGMHSKGPTKRGLGAKYYDWWLQFLTIKELSAVNHTRRSIDVISLHL